MCWLNETSKPNILPKKILMRSLKLCIPQTMQVNIFPTNSERVKRIYNTYILFCKHKARNKQHADMNISG